MSVLTFVVIFRSVRFRESLERLQATAILTVASLGVRVEVELVG